MSLISCLILSQRLPSQVFLPSIFGTQEPEEPDLPVDVSQVTLFDTMYVHPIVRDSMIIWNYYHYLALPIGSWLCSGSASGTDQWVAEVPAERFHISRRECSKNLLRTLSLTWINSIFQQGMAESPATYLISIPSDYLVFGPPDSTFHISQRASPSSSNYRYGPITDTYL